MTECSSLNSLTNCTGFVDDYSLYAVNDSVLNCVIENGGEILPQSTRYVEDESSEWAELDYKLKVHELCPG